MLKVTQYKFQIAKQILIFRSGSVTTQANSKVLNIDLVNPNHTIDATSTIIIVSAANKTLALINIFVDRCERKTKRIALQIHTFCLYKDKEFPSELLQITNIIISDHLSRGDCPAFISIKPRFNFRIGTRKNGNNFLNEITRRTIIISA